MVGIDWLVSALCTEDTQRWACNCAGYGFVVALLKEKRRREVDIFLFFCLCERNIRLHWFVVPWLFRYARVGFFSFRLSFSSQVVTLDIVYMQICGQFVFCYQRVGKYVDMMGFFPQGTNCFDGLGYCEFSHFSFFDVFYLAVFVLIMPCSFFPFFLFLWVPVVDWMFERWNERVVYFHCCSTAPSPGPLSHELLPLPCSPLP